MEENDDYSMLFTNSLEVFEYQTWKKASQPFCKLENKDYTGAELLKDWLVPTATVVYRNIISYEFKNVDLFLFYDIPLFLKLSQYGKIRGLNEVTAVYRRHDKSITNQEIPYKKGLTHYKALKKEFPNKFNDVVLHLLAEDYFQQAKIQYKSGSYRVIYFLLLSLFNDPTVIIYALVKRCKG